MRKDHHDDETDKMVRYKMKNFFKGDNCVISADFGNSLRLVGMTYSLASSQKERRKEETGRT